MNLVAIIFDFMPSGVEDEKLFYKLTVELNDISNSYPTFGISSHKRSESVKAVGRFHTMLTVFKNGVQIGRIQLRPTSTLSMYDQSQSACLIDFDECVESSNSKTSVAPRGAESTIQIEEFDPGSERTLAAWLRHASRTDYFEE
jgi:hypothetical protein